jgi:uncharacterized protein involved in exopolysaccharide biosynthesis/Mrp family chromosome partitioning ATPase
MTTSSPAFDPASAKGLGIKPLASLRAHRALALVVLAITLLVAAPVAWMKGQPRYAATATVQVAPRYMKNLREDKEVDFQSNSQYRQFVEHQARSVGRFDILAAAIESAAARGHPWRQEGESVRRAVERLQERIVVTPVADTYLMQISLEGAEKEGLAETVNAVVSAYIELMKDEAVYGSDERTKAVLGREAELLKAVRELSDRRTAIALEVGVSTFSESDGNPYDKLLLAARSAHEEAQRARIAAEAKLRAFETTKETDIVTRSIQENVLNDPGLNSLKSSLNTRRAALAMAMSGLTPDHPAYEAAKSELAEIDAEIARRSGQLNREVATSIRARYEATVDQARRYEQEMGQILAEREARSARAAKLYNDALALGADITAARKELDAVRERLNFFSGERQALGFVRLVTPAFPPETGYGPGRKKLLLAALMFALLLAVVAPVALDLADGRVRAVGDAERALAMPALGWLVEGEGAAARLFAEDQLRRMGSALARERDRHGTQVFALSAVKPGAGTTGLALALARTLDGLGYPTLVVEANAFSPDARYASPRAGLAHCLRGEAEAHECVAPADGQLPARVRFGGEQGESHLGRVDRLRTLLDEWRAHYAFVLVDAPPLLLAADAEIVLDRIGHALLVVEAGATTRGEIARARRVLEASAAQAAGLVVNRVRVLEAGGYLRHLLVEFLTRRKYADFASVPAWRLQLAALLSRGASLRGLATKGSSS